MATASVLHVGSDLCHRIPIMENAGFIVSRSECSISAVRRALAAGEGFDAIIFHNDVHPISTGVVSIARELSVVPIVLFENRSIACDERKFDLIIENLTQPKIWLASLAAAIEEFRKIREASRQLRLDSAAVRSQTRTLQRKIADNRAKAVELENAWRSDSN